MRALMSLAGVAKETLEICERGVYRAPTGATVSIRAEVDRAVAGTVLYRPEDFDALVVPPASTPSAPRVEVTDETTAEAARRLAADTPRVLALNFASAKNPGGGFLGGAKAQEEDLARCSALYPCQLTARGYYDANRACGSMLYTDHMIHSPEVPFFRDERLDLLESPFTVSILTAPAPNAGEAARGHRHRAADVLDTLRRRAARVLLVAAARGHRCLVLGAWGCGVFRNDPAAVADAFARGLDHERLHGAFERVVFAVYDRGKRKENLRAFQARFGG